MSEPHVSEARSYIKKGKLSLRGGEADAAISRWRNRPQENTFLDFNREPLMLHLFSTEGPALAVADVNGDGLDDVFAGGARQQAARLFIQQPDGAFQLTNEALWQADAQSWMPPSSMRRPGSVRVSGGNEFWGQHEALRDRLYLNDGTGFFQKADGAMN